MTRPKLLITHPFDAAVPLDALVASAGAIKGVAGENLRGALGWLPTARSLVTIKTDC